MIPSGPRITPPSTCSPDVGTAVPGCPAYVGTGALARPAKRSSGFLPITPECINQLVRVGTPLPPRSFGIIELGGEPTPKSLSPKDLHVKYSGIRSYGRQRALKSFGAAPGETVLRTGTQRRCPIRSPVSHRWRFGVGDGEHETQ